MALDNLGAHTDGGTITEGQDDKEDTSNKLDNLLDNSQNAFADFVVTAGGTLNLNTPQANLDIYLANGLIRLTGSPAGAFTIIVPDGDRRIAFENVSGQAATIDTVTGATPTVALPTATAKILQVRGIEFTLVADIGSGSGALLADGTVAATGNFDWADKELKKALLLDYAESVDTQPTSDGTIELDYQLGPVFDITLTQDTTFIFTNPPITGKAGAFTLIIRQDGPGGNTVTLPTVQWEGGTEPIWVTTGGNVDIVSFLTVKAGSPWYGFLGGLSFA